MTERASPLSHDETPLPSDASGLETLPPRPIPSAGGVQGLTGDFGRYQIQALLGQGGMGAVYLARDTQLDRLVALKTPRLENDPDGDLLQRFYREAKAAGTVRHANICPVYGVEELNGRPFLAMAYIEGRPMSDYISPEKPRPERQALVVVRKIALALQEAHEKGIVHRDLKPANVMIDKRGEPIVMDFGLARPFEIEQDSRITTTGVVIGSPAYMAPEQVDTELGKIGPPADQYALGVILYELITGNVPFRGSVAAIYGKIISRAPIPPRRLRPEIDPRVESLVLRMMAKRPGERFASMRAVAEAVQEILANPQAASSVKSTTGRAQRRSPQQVEALVASALHLIDGHQYDKAVELLEPVVSEDRTAELTSVLEQALELSDEVDFLTARLLKAWTEETYLDELPSVNRLLELVPDHSLGLKILEKIEEQGESWWAGFSPATPLGLSGISSLVQWSLFVGVIFCFTFGTMVFYFNLGASSQKSGLIVGREEKRDPVALPAANVPAPGGVEKRVATPSPKAAPPVPGGDSQPGPSPSSAGITGISQVWSLGGDEATFGKRGRIARFSPDGKYIAVSDGDRPPQVISVASGKVVRKIPQEADTSTAFLPDSSEVLLLKRTIRSPIQSINILTGATRDAVLAQVRPPYNFATPTRDQSRLLLEGRWDYLCVYDWKSNDLSEEQINFPNFKYDPEKSHLAPNGDGSIVAFAHGPTADVIVWDRIDKQQLARFNAHPQGKWLTSIHFSPDGRSLATTSHDQTVKFWNARTGALEKEYPSDDWMQSGDYSPDGRYFAAASQLKGTTIRDLVSGNLVATIPAYRLHMSSVVFSPDGKFLAGISSEHSGRPGPKQTGYAELKLWKLEFGSPKSSPSSNAPRELQAPFSQAEAQLAQQKWSDYLKQPVEFPNSLGMKIRLIPPGRFRMGSLESKEVALKFAAATGVKDPPPDSFNEEYPAHDVRILPFALSTTEVTFAQFRKFVEATGHKTQAEKDGKGKGFFSDKEGPKVDKKYSFRNIGIPLDNNYPAVNVSWDDAQAFCKWLSRSENKKYRLPYEAEWEYACRAGTITRFVSGDDPQSLVRIANVGDASARSRFPQWNYSLSGNDGYPRLAPVAQFSANPFGLYDMHGNVWEWCQDVYQKDYYRSAPDLPTPQGPMEGDGRVLRGGSHSSLPRSIRSSERGFNEITHKDTNLGFRVALEIPLP